MRKIFGHRGLPNVYEENTFKSLNKALEICDFVETDVRITKDEELVLYHDTTIQTKQIEECTLSDIDELINIEISEIHLISREQIKGDTNFELKINFKFDQLNNVFLKKIINSFKIFISGPDQCFLFFSQLKKWFVNWKIKLTRVLYEIIFILF